MSGNILDSLVAGRERAVSAPGRKTKPGIVGYDKLPPGACPRCEQMRPQVKHVELERRPYRVTQFVCQVCADQAERARLLWLAHNARPDSPEMTELNARIKGSFADVQAAAAGPVEAELSGSAREAGSDTADGVQGAHHPIPPTPGAGRDAARAADVGTITPTLQRTEPAPAVAAFERIVISAVIRQYAWEAARLLGPGPIAAVMPIPQHEDEVAKQRHKHSKRNGHGRQRPRNQQRAGNPFRLKERWQREEAAA